MSTATQNFCLIKCCDVVFKVLQLRWWACAISMCMVHASNIKGVCLQLPLHNMKQYRAEGFVRLFAGWDGYENGGQQRDFVFVEDGECKLHFLDHASSSGVYNCGTGRAQPFNDVAMTVVNTMRAHEGLEVLSLEQLVAQGLIRYVDFPNDLKGRYQSHTQADLTQLRSAGYQADFSTVAEGVKQYVEAELI